MSMRPVSPSRRALLLGAAAAGLLPRRLRAEAAFGFESVVALAKARAAAAYRPSRPSLSAPFAGLSYDDYRAIRFRPERRLWAGEGRGFEAEPAAPGSLFEDAVSLAEVIDGSPTPLPFDAGVFAFGTDRFALPDGAAPPGTPGHWTGFRLRAAVNRPETMDEVAVFQGASYFRAIGRDQIFGLSARGLAVRTAAPEGEEFPVFTDFWLHRPEPGSSEIVVDALLDSASVTGAFEFRIRPGAETVMDVTAALLPRVDLVEYGLAPLTSMYWFGPRDHVGVDDARDAVHDSSGLQMVTGRGERVWRPLSNPAALQLSTFADAGPRGFGLAQRERRFSRYQDLEARYERRPTAWIAPVGDWGAGGVRLVEIPTGSEIHDNIVAYWRPDNPLPAGFEHRFAYRLTWGERPPDETPLARVVSTREGRAPNDTGLRAIWVDFDLGESAPDGLVPAAEAARGRLEGVRLQRLPGERMLRVSLDFRPPDTGDAELRLLLNTADGAPASETWLYRWSRR